MATLKTMGGNSYTKARLYFEREANRGTKNLEQANAFRQIARLEREMGEGKITEDEFAEQQSDILTAFTAKYGDATPPSEETAEAKQARRERKACKKAVDEKEKMTLIAENGFVEGYTIILTGGFAKEESDRIKALDDPTKEVYNKTYKPFKEYLQYRYKADYNTELKLLTKLEEGKQSGILHLHNMLNTPFKITDDNVDETLAWLEDCFKHYSGATIARAEVAHKVGGVWAIAPYMSKCFFDFEQHKKGKHYYWCTDNLRHIDIEKQKVDDNAVRTVIGKARQGEDELVAYIEDQPEMENKRVIDVYFHDAEERIDDITIVELTIVNVTADIEAGKLGKKRSAADVEIFEHIVPLFARYKHYGEDALPEQPLTPFRTREWVDDPATKTSDNTPSAPIPQPDTPTPMPRYRRITFCGLSWLEEMPTPQEGRRIVCSNGLIFDELDVDL